jgi:hypothetical protein
MKKSIVSISLLMALALMLASCFSPWQGNGGALTISFGNSKADSRAVAGGTNTYLLTHIITVTDSSGAVYEATITPGGGSVYFPFLALGPCKVVVEGYIGNELQTVGTTTVDIKAGSNSAAIRMILSPKVAAANVAEFLRGLDYDDLITVTEDGAGRVIVEPKEDPQIKMFGPITLDIPPGVTVRWGVNTLSVLNDTPTITLTGSGTLEITEGTIVQIGGGNRGFIIFIESGSPTLILSGVEFLSGGNGNNIKTAPGSSPNIFISGGTTISGGPYDDAIRLEGGGTITVSGDNMIGSPSPHIIYRGPSATVRGYYGSGTNTYNSVTSSNRDLFIKGNTWTEGVNLFKR